MVSGFEEGRLHSVSESIYGLLLIQKNKSIWIASNNYYRQDGRYVLSERTSTVVLNKTPIFKTPHKIKYEVTTANE